MTRNHEMRLAKLEQALAPREMTHDDWVLSLPDAPIPSPTQLRSAQRQRQRELLAEHGSYEKALAVLQEERQRSKTAIDIMAANLAIREVEDAIRAERRDAELIALHGSLSAAVAALKAKATTLDPFPGFEAEELRERLQEARLVA